MNINYETVKQDIIKKIENSELPPNSPIMTRKELKDKYKVAVATVDRAILDLKNEGYLYGIQGKGTFVAEKSKAHKRIGLIFCSLSHSENNLGPYYLKVLEFFQRKAFETNDSTCIFMPGDDISGKALRTYFNSPEADVYIIFALEGMETLHELMSLGKPVVVVNPRISIPDDIPVVKEDSRQIMFEFGDYFIRKKYRKVAYIWPKSEKQIFRDRKEWLERFCINNGITFDNEFSCQISKEKEDINILLKKYLSSTSRPDAIVFSRASFGVEAYAQMKEMNLKIPENTGLFLISDRNTSPAEVRLFTRVELDEAAFAGKIFSVYGQISENETGQLPDVYVQGRFIEGITG